MKTYKNDLKIMSDSEPDGFFQHSTINMNTTATNFMAKTSPKRVGPQLMNDTLYAEEPHINNKGYNDDFNESQSATTETNKHNKNGSNSSVDEDIQRIVEEIKNPKDLQSAIESYVLRSTYIDKVALINNPHTKTKRFKDCLYFGNVLNGIRHGKGIMIYTNGRIYEGDWENELKHGQGLEISPNGNSYEGSFMNGKPEGLGTFLWKNGEVYKGEWRCGLKHGSGMWKGIKGESFVGEWKNGKPDGHGVHVWRNGDRYEGEFMSSLKHGHGTEKFANGDLFIGNYQNGKPGGFGEYHWSNGNSYKGFFKNGLRHGKGVWRKDFGKSDTYNGEWVNDKKVGYGVYIWQSGNTYKGSYFDDLRHGYGEMQWTDGSCYKGEWRRGAQHGEGELYVPGRPLQRGVFNQNVYCGASDIKDSSLMASNGIEGSKDQKDLFTKLPTKIRPPNLDSIPCEPKLTDNFKTQTHMHHRRRQSDDSFIDRNKYRHSSSFELSSKELDSFNFDIQNGQVKDRKEKAQNLAKIQNLETPMSREDYEQIKKRIADKIIKDLGQYPLSMLMTGKALNGDHSLLKTNFKPTFNYRTQYVFQEEPEKKLNMDRAQSTSPAKIKNVVKPLDNKELIKWHTRKEQLPTLEQKKYKDESNPETIAMIREVIKPRVWRHWGKGSTLPGKSDVYVPVIAQGTTSNFYKGYAN